jgi:hypothetical protein
MKSMSSEIRIEGVCLLMYSIDEWMMEVGASECDDCNPTWAERGLLYFFSDTKHFGRATDIRRQPKVTPQLISWVSAQKYRSIEGSNATAWNRRPEIQVPLFLILNSTEILSLKPHPDRFVDLHLEEYVV